MNNDSSNYVKEQIDPLILPAVQILNEYGFKTFESCQGGENHCYHEPTVRFEGSEFDLIRAFEICKLRGLHPYEAKRVFVKNPVYLNDNTPQAEIIGEVWETPFNEISFIIY